VREHATWAIEQIRARHEHCENPAPAVKLKT
jgi:hypothetical protein